MGPNTFQYSLPNALWITTVFKGLPGRSPNFLNRQDACFKKLHGTCDTVFRSLRESGVGTVKRSAQTFQSVGENKLQESNVFNTGTAEGLQTVFFYVGKVCCLRGGQEQRELKISQFERFNNPERYVYSKYGSKNRNGGFYQLDIENKNVEIHKNTTVIHKAFGKKCQKGYIVSH